MWEIDDDAIWPVSTAMQGDSALVDLSGAEYDGLPTGAWQHRPTQALVVPLLQQGGSPTGFLVDSLSQHPPVDVDYRWPFYTS